MATSQQCRQTQPPQLPHDHHDHDHPHDDGHNVRARKCVCEDHVAEGVPAPRGKSLEIRGLGGKLSYEILFNDLRSGKTKVFKYKR
jgi:hypothetical protein